VPVSGPQPGRRGGGVLPWDRRDVVRASGQVPASRHYPLPRWTRHRGPRVTGTALEPLRTALDSSPAADGLDEATRTLLELARTAASAAAAVTPPPLLPAGAVEAMAALAGAGLAPNTEAARASDWAGFTRWCTTGGHVPLPAHPLLVRWYVTAKAAELKPDGSPAYAPATLTRWVATINAAHTAAGFPRPGRDEGVTQALSAIRRVRATPPRRRAPLLTDDIRALLTTARTAADTAGWAARAAERRDSCLLLFGLAGALRRSELVGLTVADITPSRADGLVITLRRSKTDQEAAGRTVTLPYGVHPETCPVCAHLRWRQVLDAHTAAGRPGVIRLLRRPEPFTAHCCHTEPAPTSTSARADSAGTPGWLPLLRTVHRSGALGDTPLTGQAVAQVVRRRAAAAGFGPEAVARLGGHSLRVGFVTQAVRNGATTQTVMAQTGHSDERMVSVYARRHAGLVGNAVTQIGL
jgi:integrase